MDYSAKYIGKNVILEIEQDYLKLQCSGTAIAEHRVSTKPLNYRKEDYSEILRSDVFKDFNEAKLENLH
ncbi:hypothetical protein [Lactococcus garvieae]|uniref:hypothetical protein n=1 Tax=Lactococcus garvieae TaxID=1363 RepID=UPI003852FCFD